MVLVNLTMLQTLMNLGKKPELKFAKEPPLFQVAVSLSAFEVIKENGMKLHYDEDLSKKHCGEYSTLCDGWMGHASRPQVIGEDEESVIFNFYTSISPLRCKVFSWEWTSSSGMEKTFQKIHKYLDMWRYSTTVEDGQGSHTEQICSETWKTSSLGLEDTIAVTRGSQEILQNLQGIQEDHVRDHKEHLGAGGLLPEKSFRVTKRNTPIYLKTCWLYKATMQPFFVDIFTKAQIFNTCIKDISDK